MSNEDTRPTPEQIAEARDLLAKLEFQDDDVGMAVNTLRAATEPQTDEDLAGICADYAVDVVGSRIERTDAANSYLRDIKSGDAFSHGAFVKYVSRRLFGPVKP
jgi:thiamine biosynthesis lipoprotein ApbE